MNEVLRITIQQLRSSLSELDDGPRIGDIRPGNTQADSEILAWREVLKECDGGRFGAIDLWSSEELPLYQQTTLPVDNASDYVVVGQILYEPVAIERTTELLFWLPRNEQPVTLGTADNFLSHFVFGAGYGELIPDVEEEPWWQFLSSHARTI